MLCLHGKPAATSTTEKGTFWFCGEPSKCHFICHDDQAFLYGEAVKAFLATKQARPVCCAVGPNRVKIRDNETTERNYAKIRVVRDAEKASFGRPFFTCPKENDKCGVLRVGR